MYPKEYIEYLAHFHGDRDYFECHEVLEEYWKKVDKSNKKSILVGFILFAVSSYHHRRRNFNGAKRTLKKAIEIFNEQRTQLVHYGLSANPFMNVLSEQLISIQNLQDYQSLNLPIHDEELLISCQEACLQKGFTWAQKSDLTNEELIHRHLTRDRSEVIADRNRALHLSKQKGRE